MSSLSEVLHRAAAATSFRLNFIRRVWRPEGKLQTRSWRHWDAELVTPRSKVREEEFLRCPQNFKEAQAILVSAPSIADATHMSEDQLRYSYNVDTLAGKPYKAFKGVVYDYSDVRSADLVRYINTNRANTDKAQNVTLVSRRGIIVVVAIRNIRAGEELLNGYRLVLQEHANPRPSAQNIGNFAGDERSTSRAGNAVTGLSLAGRQSFAAVGSAESSATSRPADDLLRSPSGWCQRIAAAGGFFEQGNPQQRSKKEGKFGSFER